MEELAHLHDFINLILVFIIRFVGIIIILIVISPYININLLDIQMVE